MKKRYIMTLSASSLLLLSACSQANNDKTDQASPKDNFYAYVNQDWIDKTEIPADAVAYGVVSEMTEEIDGRLKNDVEALVSGKESSDLDGMDEFVSLYKVATDFKKRDQDGAKPAQKYLDEIEKINSLEELSKVSQDWILKGLPLPFTLAVDINGEDTTQKQLSLGSPGSLLPDVSIYENKDQKEQLLSLYSQTAVGVLEKMGYSSDEAKKIVDGAVAFDGLIVPYLLSAEEASDIKNSVNLRSASEVSAYSTFFDFSKLANNLVGQDVATFNVETVNYFEHLATIVTEENFPKLKSWLILQEAMSDASYLSEDIRETASQYSMALSGIEELSDKTSVAYDLALGTFSSTFSVYYGQKYFSPEDKQNVTDMVDNIVAVYKDRLSTNDWLSDETKSKAIEKLDKMTYYIGYPEEVAEDVKLIDIDEDKSLLDNMVDISRIGIAYSFEHFNEPVDKTEWIAPSYEVNAFYAPTNNSITFPAAILQAPFYSEEQSEAMNYGAIGSVIGHEITHAFDNNGALFDADGNMRNWWTEADFAAFEKKTQEMISHFDGADYEGHKVNGTLTVGENIADSGGLSASLEALKKVNPKADLKEFFENYALTYRGVIRPEFIQYLLLDTHAPDSVRVNLQMNLLPEFYETYDLKEGDGLYLPEEKRVKIW